MGTALTPTTTEDFIRQQNRLVRQVQRLSQPGPAIPATIDPYWTSGLPSVILDGETDARGGQLYDLSGTDNWQPVPGQRVYCIPSTTGFIIAGPIAESRSLMNAIAIPLQAGKMVQYGTAFKDWTVSMSAAGIVVLEGLASPAVALAAGDILATLPAPFVPDTGSGFRLRFPVNYNDTPTDLYVYSDGTIRAVRAIASGSFLSLTGIAFPAASAGAVWADAGAQSAGTPIDLANGWLNSGDTSFPNARYWTDPYGATWFQGQLTNAAATPTNNGAMLQFNVAGFAPSRQALPVIAGNGGGFGFVGIDDGTHAGANGVGWRLGTAWAANGVVSLDGLSIQNAASDATLPWVTPSLSSSWVVYDAVNFATPGYVQRPDGLALARGLAKSGTIGNAPFAVPSPYKPKGYLGDTSTGVASGLLQNVASNAARGRVDLRRDGNMVVVAGSNLWVSFDGVIWAPEW